jgi:hypothetical protein
MHVALLSTCAQREKRAVVHQEVVNQMSLQGPLSLGLFAMEWYFARNIPENLRGRKTPKRGRKQHFDAAIFEESFRTIERVFAWEAKFRRLLLRFERISQVHYVFKTIAYTLVDLRHYCRS